MNYLLVKDDLFWKQRINSHRYKDGDLNTQFYHAAKTSRKKVNIITSLTISYGETCTSNGGMCMIAKDYFTELFQKVLSSRKQVLHALSSTISKGDNDMLTVTFAYEEFKETIFPMHVDKCPSLDRFNPGFYQHLRVTIRWFLRMV